MITITKQNDGVLFTFQDSDKYLYGNGTIEVPFNTLSIIADESDMITLKKAASNDVFISGRYDTDFGYRSKDDAIDDLKGMLFAETGGGSESGITSGEVQTMIDESISGKADTTYVNQIASHATDAITALTQTVSNNYDELTGQTSNLDANKFGYASYDSTTHRINFYPHDDTETPLAYVDASAFIKDGMVSNVEIINGNLVITFNSDAGKQPISIPLTDIFNPANYYTTAQTQSYVSGFTYDKATIDQKVAEGGTFDPDLYYDKTATNALLAAKADTATTYTKTETDTALATKVATSDFNTYTAATETALNGKVDTSALNNYYTKTEVYNKQEVDATYGTAYQALTAHTADTTVHVTSADKTAWNNKSDFSGDYNDLTNKPTIPTVPTNISDFTNDAGYITSADITGKADTSAVTAAIDAATSGKVDTSAITSSITSGSTDSEIPTAKAVYDAIPTGGGATYSAGQGISIDTANTISFAVPIYSGATGNVFHPTYNNNSIIIGNSNNRASNTSVAGGNACTGQSFSFTYGVSNNATGSTSVAIGNRLNAINDREAAFGTYNVSNKANTTFGDSGNTLFSVGNGTGTGTNANHNAFEIRQNGDIYITSGNTDIKLQDHLGGGGGGGVTVDPTLDTGSTNPVANSAITQALENKLDASAYTPTDLSEYWTSAQTQSAIDGVNNALTAHTANTTVHVTSVEKDAWNAKANIDHVTQAEYSAMEQAGTLDSNTMYIIDDAVPFDPSTKVDVSAITSAITSGSTDSEIPTAKATYDAIQAGGGGGATYSAGTNISIDTANTINCTIPAYFNSDARKGDIAIGTNINNTNSDYYKLVIGRQIDTYENANSSYSVGIAPATNNSSLYSQLKGHNSVGIGKYFQITGHQSVAIGSETESSIAGGVAIGYRAKATGTTKMNLNGQIKVDTNNQVYIKDKTNTTDVCIQDAIAALGGLKFVSLSQSEYDALQTKDANTLYIISNVVS